jgi:hypothetical protein
MPPVVTATSCARYFSGADGIASRANTWSRVAMPAQRMRVTVRLLLSPLAGEGFAAETAKRAPKGRG